ncbi:FHA domain-containing protein [Streptomyces subrutilus]|uniref:FHA domain-containing protein n=1 Tax=Streptomyces subrutilus TaxID=36818 RepID=UPI002E0D5D70|nr:FHA domain-containing protein [Streptomyces subrutilus]
MQIRLTVLGSRSGHQTAPASCDVLVTAPLGTALAAVASGLAATVGGPDTGGTVVLYAGAERLDLQRRVLGEPPLVDGAVLALNAPVPDVLPEEDLAAPQLHVVAGPDAGGVHLLHSGLIRVGRSADADVPLDDPDVSRLHCAVSVLRDGRVAVADLNSTNGTTLDGAPVGPQQIALPPGALLRVGESTLRLAATGAAPLPVTPDLEGHLAVPGRAVSPTASHLPRPGGPSDGPAPASLPAARSADSPLRAPAAAAGHPGATGHGQPAQAGPAGGHGRTGAPAHGGYAEPSAHGGYAAPPAHGGYAAPSAHGGYAPPSAHGGHAAPPSHGGYADPSGSAGVRGEAGAPASARDGSGTAAGAAGRRRGLGAWARKWVRGEEDAGEPAGPEASAVVCAAPDPDDPAALLLAALGPTERLWSRTPGHRAVLEVGLGAGSRVALRGVGGLGLAGPRARLAGVARSVVAQLAALHAPGQLEIVLVATDRARPLAERRRDWGWLGWLPHVRPAHGQDCRLLLAYDRDQALARTGELTRRLDDGPLGAHWAAADPERVREAARAYAGPYTVLVLDGDPGAGGLRDVTGRLASHGPAAGIHVLALAEAPPATAASPVTETFEAACSATPAFRDCGAVALLSGDVATAVRTFAVDGGRPAPTGDTATVDAVSAAWAERFARALAPLRADGAGAAAAADSYRPASATLPATARLLDELGLARATPASLMARWAEATDLGQGQGGLVEVVLGGGRRGPVGAELVHDGPHLLIEGPAGSGRTELLRSVAASLAAAARPDLLGLVLLDGAGGERGDGLLPCTELPHAAAHLVASDPLRMREFAQALGAELKRRSELLEGVPFAEWHARREVSGRLVSPRRPSPGEVHGEADPPRTGTLRLRAAALRNGPPGPSPLPRLVVLVDDLDALVAPGLGSTGRPAAGSVVRALEAVAREGARLGVHLVATSARPDRTAETGLARLTTLRVELDAPDQPGPGRGLLRYADGRTVPFQAGRVTGRIPRTATLRPTVVPVEWERMGDPPARRPVRELGNGPTDLALLASALDRASHLVSATPVLFPPAP